MSVATPSQLQNNLVREYWDLKLYDESLFRDIFSRLRTIFDYTSNIDMPLDTLVFELDAQASTGFRTATLGFIEALQNTPRYGNAQQQIGFEETLREKSQTIYYNEMSHAVALWNYGIAYNDQNPYGINMGKATALLANYMEELFGLHYRQALLQRFAVNLTFAPTNQTQVWNNHWYIKNVGDVRNQPAYSTVLQTHTNNIANALIAAGTGVNSTLDSIFLTGLMHYITTNRIEPLVIDGEKCWILTVPTNQVYHVHDLDRNDGLASYWTSVSRMPDKKANFPYLLGKWIKIYLVEDERAPTLTLSGSAAPFTLTPGYVLPGNIDQRDTSDGARDVGFLMGKAPLIDWYYTRVHHKYDDYNYQKWEGKGAFAERGVQLRWYDDVTATNTSAEQRYSVVCVWGRGTIRS